MNMQQWAILCTGTGLVLIMAVAIGGPVLEMECTGQQQCEESFEDLFIRMVLSMLAMAIGTPLLITGIILFVVDGVERRKQHPAEGTTDEPQEPTSDE